MTFTFTFSWCFYIMGW